MSYLEYVLESEDADYRHNLNISLNRIGVELIGIYSDGAMIVNKIGNENSAKWINIDKDSSHLLQKALGHPWY